MIMPRSKIDLAIAFLDSSFRLMIEHLEDLSLEDALFVPEGGYRSVLGTLKHTAAWNYIYHSYAFDENPTHWKDINWPYGLMDTVDKSQDYLLQIVAWFSQAHTLWVENLRALEDEQLEEMRRLHWGEEAPLIDIVGMIARHHVYHAGELNQILSIRRGEAWEEGEEVEENNIDTRGHRVKPPWLEDNS